MLSISIAQNAEVITGHLAASQEVASPSSECREGVDIDFFIASAPGSRGGRAGHGVSGTYGPGT